jgi:hypothetical protein
MGASSPPPNRQRRGQVAAGMRADARLVAAAVAAGVLLGLVLAGIGGRLAMRVMTLTSDPAVLGMVTDDGFIVGEFDLSQSVRFVVEDGMGTGILAALAWLAVRPLLGGPHWIRHVTYAGTLGLLFGAVTVHPGGVDFTALHPVWLSVVLFGLGPAAVFGIVSFAVERVTAPGGRLARAPERRALLPLTVFLVTPFLIPLLVMAALVSGARHAARRTAAFTWLRAAHPWPLWLGRLALFAIFSFSASKLIRDTVTLLGVAG